MPTRALGMCVCVCVWGGGTGAILSGGVSVRLRCPALLEPPSPNAAPQKLVVAINKMDDHSVAGPKGEWSKVRGLGGGRLHGCGCAGCCW